jgi:hypothetical protein
MEQPANAAMPVLALDVTGLLVQLSVPALLPVPVVMARVTGSPLRIGLLPWLLSPSPAAWARC